MKSAYEVSSTRCWLPSHGFKAAVGWDHLRLSPLFLSLTPISPSTIFQGKIYLTLIDELLAWGQD